MGVIVNDWTVKSVFKLDSGNIPAGGGRRIFRTSFIFGTDFPNLPFAWDRELKAVLSAGLDDAQRDAILYGNAAALFGER